MSDSRSRSPYYPRRRSPPRRRSRSRSRSRSRNRRREYEVTIRNPEEPSRPLILRIPSYRECRRAQRHPRRRIYCGTRSPIPSGYARRGTQMECLRKGFGAGRCSIFSPDNDELYSRHRRRR